MRNKISPSGLFFLVFISRIVVSLTAVSSLTFGNVGTDILISIVLSLGLTLIYALPAIWCYRKGKSPFETGFTGLLYFLFFIFMSAINVSRFSYFASTTLNPETQAWLFIVIICLFAWYCCRLGIEALTRFSAFAFFLALAGITFAIAFNIKNFQQINLYPAITGSTSSILKNALIISGNTTELAFLLCLKNRVNGNAVKSFTSGIIWAYVTIFALLYVILGVMGNAAGLEDFPVFTLFQITKLSNYERLDVLHISFWIMGLFIKTVLFQYCSCVSLKSFSMNTKCTVAAVATFVLSIVFSKVGLSQRVAPPVISIPFYVFCVGIPLITLIFGKRRKRNELTQGH